MLLPYIHRIHNISFRVSITEMSEKCHSIQSSFLAMPLSAWSDDPLDLIQFCNMVLYFLVVIHSLYHHHQTIMPFSSFRVLTSIYFPVDLMLTFCAYITFYDDRRCDDDNMMMAYINRNMVVNRE